MSSPVCIPTAAGSRAHLVRASVLGTAQLLGADPRAACEHLLLVLPPP